MVGYPTFTGNGLSLRTVFTPAAVIGGKVKVESELTPANGEWPVTVVHHELESLTPNGAWFTHLELARVNDA